MKCQAKFAPLNWRIRPIALEKDLEPIYYRYNMHIDVSPYILRFQQRKSARKSALKSHYAKALEVAAKAAELLRTRFDAKRVVAFGSVTHENLFHFGSDVDLAVWELGPGAYFLAVGQLQSIDPSISIDLVMFQDAPEESLQRLILQEGIDL